MTKQKVIVIGAGVGGLATATLFAKAGYEVNVYEKNNHPGGRMGVLEKEGFTFDTGPSWYLMPEIFEQYFNLLGKDRKKLFKLERLSPAYKVFFEDQEPISVYSDLQAAAEQFEAIEPGTGKALKKYVNDANNIYDLAVKYFLYTNFTNYSSFLKLDILRHTPLFMRTATTSMHRYIQRKFSDSRLQQILEYPMVFLGSSPFKIPAIYSLMAALDFKQGVYYPHGGMKKLRDTMVELAAEQGVFIHTNSEVASIDVVDGSASGIRLRGTNELIKADIVVSNADLHHTENALLEEKYRSYDHKKWNTLQPGPSAILVFLGIKGQLPEIEHHTLLFTKQWQQNFADIFDNHVAPSPASIYLSRTSATDDQTAPKGCENVFMLVPYPPSTDASESKLEQLVEQYLVQVEQMTGVNDLRRRILTKTIYGPSYFKDTFNAWEGTALGPSHILKQSGPFRSSNKSKKVTNLYYVGGSTLPGIGVPMCLISAQLVYKRVKGITHNNPLTSKEL